jgi:hypothetical protein
MGKKLSKGDAMNALGLKLESAVALVDAVSELVDSGFIKNLPEGHLNVLLMHAASVVREADELYKKAD